MLALWFGISLSPCRHVTYSVIWWLIAAISFMAMYLLETWAAYIGKFQVWNVKIGQFDHEFISYV